MKKSALHDEDIARDAGGQSWWSLPPEDLRPWVVAFIGRQDLGMRQRFTIFPNAQAELFFHFGSPYLTNRRLEEPLEALATASLFAPKLECNEHQCGPCVDWFLIQLTPAGCRALLGHPVGALLQRDLPLTAFWGDEVLDLQAQLAAKHDFKARVDTGSAWLRRRRIASGDRGDLAISRICNRSRAVPVATVADAAAQSSLGV